MEIYTALDLLEDIARVIRFDKPVYMINYDDLVLKIYYHRKKQIALTTIMNKLRQLERTGYIKIIRTYTCEHGLCYSEKAKVILYKSVIYSLTRFSRTIELKPQQTLLNYLQR